ncbi:MAG: tRNA dihydrouridine synthase [Anaerolineaceae bacterium]
MNNGFFVGNVHIPGDLILAPMDGFSDSPFRSVARKLGSAASYSEFINGIDVLHGTHFVEDKLNFLPEERPLIFQIFDQEPARILKVALELEKHHPDIIDINMGCPTKSVSGRGAGAGLLQEPEKIEEIFSTLSKVLSVPLSGKIRLGWDDKSRNYLTVAKIIEDNGGKMLAVHGRTREQLYTGKADWDAIAEVKSILSIPVIGNGDVQLVEDISRMKEHTGCDAVMIGRAAIGNPWIFSHLNRDDVKIERVYETMTFHLNRMFEFYGPEFGLVLFRKHTTRYLAPYNLPRDIRSDLLTEMNPHAFKEMLSDIFFKYQLFQTEDEIFFSSD